MTEFDPLENFVKPFYNLFGNPETRPELAGNYLKETKIVFLGNVLGSYSEIIQMGFPGIDYFLDDIIFQSVGNINGHYLIEVAGSCEIGTKPPLKTKFSQTFGIYILEGMPKITQDIFRIL